MGYVVQYRNWWQGEDYHHPFLPIAGRTTERVDLLIWAGARAHQFWVKAFNGTLYSAWSACLIPSDPAPNASEVVSIRPTTPAPLALKESQWRLRSVESVFRR